MCRGCESLTPSPPFPSPSSIESFLPVPLLRQAIALTVANINTPYYVRTYADDRYNTHLPSKLACIIAEHNTLLCSLLVETTISFLEARQDGDYYEFVLLGILPLTAKAQKIHNNNQEGKGRRSMMRYYYYYHHYYFIIIIYY